MSKAGKGSFKALKTSSPAPKLKATPKQKLHAAANKRGQAPTPPNQYGQLKGKAALQKFRRIATEEGKKAVELKQSEISEIPAFKGERKQGMSNVVGKVMSSEEFKKKNISKWTKFKIRI